MKLPCENCICFPTCKSLYEENKEKYLKVLFINRIQDKCSIILDLLSECNDEQHRKMIERIIQYFNEY